MFQAELKVLRKNIASGKGKATKVGGDRDVVEDERLAQVLAVLDDNAKEGNTPNSSSVSNTPPTTSKSAPTYACTPAQAPAATSSSSSLLSSPLPSVPVPVLSNPPAALGTPAVAVAVAVAVVAAVVFLFGRK